MIYAVMQSTEGRREEAEVFPAVEDAQRVFRLRVKRFAASPSGCWSEGYLLADFESMRDDARTRGRRARSVRSAWLGAERRRSWANPGPSPTLLVWRRRPSDPVPDVTGEPGERWQVDEAGVLVIEKGAAV